MIRRRTGGDVGLILITGSTDGIGAQIGRELAERGHRVIRHARNAVRAERCRVEGVREADIVVGEFASLASIRAMAATLASMGRFDVVIHNAGWAAPETDGPKTDGPDTDRPVTEDGFEQTFQVNVLAPYVLSAVTPPPGRQIMVSSDSIVRGRIDLDDLQHERNWTPGAAYADSKLAVTALAFGLARLRPQTLTNAVHPGWVRTKMSGYQAPLSVEEGADTIVWLATSTDAQACVSGHFFHERRVIRVNEQAYDVALQAGLMAACAGFCGLP
jgi:NAD(P)-dependent dehydrogenase (short-subunit alcohol dehydrogenase family)